jgi:hypothetical protein
LKIWDYWARNYRNVRGIGVALVMFAAILSMLSMRCNPVVDQKEILSIVVEIEAYDVHPLGTTESNTRVIVATPDSSDVRIFLPPPKPKVGDFVPLTAEYFKKGNIEYFVDQQKWRTEGAQ